MKPARLLCILLGSLVAACGGGGGGGASAGSGGGSVPSGCGAGAQKFVLDVTREWYLFPETLPEQVSTAGFTDAQELLEFLTATARAQGRDRHFSYVTTRQADSSFLQEGQFIGLGFRMRIEGSRVFFLEAYESSPASEAGIARGGELLAVDSGSGYVSVANLLPTDPNLSTALGPAQEDVARGLRFTRPGVAQPVEARLTKRSAGRWAAPRGRGPPGRPSRWIPRVTWKGEAGLARTPDGAAHRTRGGGRRAIEPRRSVVSAGGLCYHATRLFARHRACTDPVV